MWNAIISFFRRLLAGTSLHVQNPDMDPLTQLYYVPIDNDGNEKGAPILVSLNPDGSADLSRLPADLQSTLTTFGTPNELRTKTMMPKDGSAFLEALFETQGPYRRFRKTA